MTQVTPVLSRSPADRHSYLVPQDVPPMLAERGIPRSLDGWAAGPKLDRWRARVLADDGQVG